MFASNTSQVSNGATYIEDVFSTYLYTGTSAPQTITNGIDLAGKGGLVTTKVRSTTGAMLWQDTANGVNTYLRSDSTAALATGVSGVTNFGSTGFSLDSNNNTSAYTYASWTFRKQPKFFDVVTYTATGTNRTVSHNLGSVPGCIIVKCTSAGSTSWAVYHRSLGNTVGLILNGTDAAITANFWGNTTPTATEFTVGDIGSVNYPSGATYVAYLFAHNAGGFGLTGTDNVISCGSYTGNGSTTGPEINLGYEPQWVLIKDATNASPDWWVFDNMRGVATGGVDMGLRPNTSGAEVTANDYLSFTATGFQPTATTNTVNQSGDTYIYIAIRRGPMKTPTSGTSVFTPYEVPASPTTGAITGFVTDAGFIGQRAGADKFYWGARLMGNPTLNSTNVNPQSANTNQIWDRMNGWWNSAINNYMTWGFARAPSFMDVVCYTGMGAARTVAHNLTVVPELIIVKDRTTSSASNKNWMIYSSSEGFSKVAHLNTTDQFYNPGVAVWGTSNPTASVFRVGAGFDVNDSGARYVAYLFASCPGVSKVGSYTGNGSSQTINCGFTGGARFVLIKRTDSPGGDWYVWDTARGIVSANDPRLSLNSTNAEVTTDDSIDPDNSGFIVNQVSATNINVSSATYIYLAIA